MSTLVQKLGGKQVALESSAGPLCRPGGLLSQQLMQYVSTDIRSHIAVRGCSICITWLKRNQKCTCTSDDSGRSAKPVCNLFPTTYYARILRNACYQVCSDIAVVILWWTPKAFKGKGQALVQSLAFADCAAVCASGSLL
jgi:hypothetical protein